MPGYDLMVQAVSGLMSLTGDPDGPPYRAGISVFDVMAGNHAVIGILAALRHRDATGQGQHVEVNLLSSALSGLVNHSSAYVAGGVVPYRMGNAHPSVFPYEPLPTADRDLIVAAANDRLVPQAVRGPRHPGGRRRPAVRAATATAPRTGPSCEPILVERLATRSADEWFDLLVAAGVPCGPINTIDGGFAMAEQFAWTRWSPWGRASGRCRWRGTRSRSPRRRPGTRCRHRSWTSTAPNSGCGSRTRGRPS